MHLLQVNASALVSFLILAFCQVPNVSGDGYGYAFSNNRRNLGYFDQRTRTDVFDEARVVGGAIANPGQFPWMAMIYKVRNGPGHFICGGTIISARWILTAGHCVVGGSRFLIVLGTNDRVGVVNSDRYSGPGVAMVTDRWTVPSRYSTAYSDIALLQTSHTIPFSNVIQPIRIAGRNKTFQSFDRQTGVIVGWGRDGSSSGGSSRILKFVSILIINNRECRRTWRHVVDSHICTFSGPGKSACTGDSGGPLVSQVNNTYIQVGVVSYGEKGCSGYNPAVFTRVSSHASWIQQVTGIAI